MKDYKRLTGAEGLGVCDAEYCENDDCLSCAAQINYDRLSEFEDKIESGELCDGAELEQVIKARDEYKHRAEVAERALRKLASFFAQNAKFLKDEREKERYQKTIFDDWINQAEKELVEEGKDD